MKYCKGCEQNKPLSDFAKSYVTAAGRQVYATLCRRCHTVKYAKQASDRQKARIAKKRETVPDGRKLRVGKRGLLVLEKKCNICNQVKQRDQFPTARSVCGDCMPVFYAANYQRYKGYYRRARTTRQVRKMGNGGSHTVAQWEALKAQHDHACLCCGKREPEITLTEDHVLPLVKGGTDSIENIQPLCGSCNSSKNAKHIDYRKDVT